MNSNNTLNDELIGTLEYMSREYLSSGITTRHNDLHALGIIGYELCIGHLPFQELSTQEFVELKVTGQFDHFLDFPGEVPERISSFIKCATTSNKDNKYRNADQMLNELHDMLSQPVGASSSFENSRLNQLYSVLEEVTVNSKLSSFETFIYTNVFRIDEYLIIPGKYFLREVKIIHLYKI